MKRKFLSGFMILSLTLSLTFPALPAFAGTDKAADVTAGTDVNAYTPASNTESFRYVHDPLLNSIAMQDIIVNPDAVYGFSPDPDSAGLAAYASFDWTSSELVENAKQERIAYHAEFESMFILWTSMLSEGKNIEEIARAVSGLRNQIRLDSYKDNPEGLAALKARNLEKYGNENGPDADSLFEKYGSWEKVLEKSFSSSSAMDACLGLYDDQYEHNKLTGSVLEDTLVKFTSRDGDTLEKIAVKFYGDKDQWKTIYEANPDAVSEGYSLKAGAVLVIPYETAESDMPLSRAGIVSVLYDLEGKTEAASDAGFTDVAADRAEKEAINWAAAKGIVLGCGNGCFAPDKNISIQDAAVILYRYADHSGTLADTPVTVTEESAAAKYADWGDVSEYARTAVLWCCSKNIMPSADGSRLNPQKEATRADMKRMLA